MPNPFQMERSRRPHFALCLVILLALASGGYQLVWSETADASASADSATTQDPIAQIRDEGLNHSQVMATLGHLTEVIGPRLTGSPNLKRANEWTRDALAGWGLSNAHLEAWGPFGRGWSLKRFSAQVIEPQAIPLIGYPNTWTPGFDKPLVADVVYFDARTNSDLEKFSGKIKGAIVLSGSLRELKPGFEPLALRMMETNLLRLANAGSTNVARIGSTREAGGGPRTRGRFQPRFLSFLQKEGAALVVNPSSSGDGGTFFVSAASVPGPESTATNSATNAVSSTTNTLRAWSTPAPAIPPQITIAAEDYNRLVRMIQQGEKVKMAVDLQVQFHDEDLMAYNTLAEIPGSDLKDQVVMIGAHLDSWHSGTGATDNGAGVAATMEAMRILSALKLHPRRTIRIGLWTGEEQGLLGSKAYVTKHFGYYTNETTSTPARSPKVASNNSAPTVSARTNATPRKLIRQPEYDRFSVYFNLDNGAGKIRGVYMQGNESARTLFRSWLNPLADLGAETLTLSNTGGTDHSSFDAIALPGFQFIQDPLEYNSRTHHSNQDVLDRIQPEDLKQASVILAAFAYQAAMNPDKFPRKPLADATSGTRAGTRVD